MNVHYQHRQIGWVMLVMGGLPLLALIVFAIYLGLRGSLQPPIILFLAALPLAASLVFFSSMTVEVSDVASVHVV